MIDEKELMKYFTPLWQLLYSVVLGAILIFVYHTFSPGRNDEFTGAFIGILFFAVANNVVGIFKEKFVPYFLPSYGYYFALCAALILLAKYMAAKSIWDLPSYQVMFMCVTLFYFTSGILMRLIRAIYMFAENDEIENRIQ